jgi:hypothetical protein
LVATFTTIKTLFPISKHEINKITKQAATQDGRKRLLDLGAAETLRAGYEFEEHPGVCAAMEAAGRHLFIASAADDEDEEEEEAAGGDGADGGQADAAAA